MNILIGHSHAQIAFRVPECQSVFISQCIKLSLYPTRYMKSKLTWPLKVVVFTLAFSKVIELG